MIDGSDEQEEKTQEGVAIEVKGIAFFVKFPFEWFTQIYFCQRLEEDGKRFLSVIDCFFQMCCQEGPYFLWEISDVRIWVKL